MLAKQRGLLPLVCLVIKGGSSRLLAGQAVVIQSRLTEGDTLGVPRQFMQSGPQVLRRFGGVGGMPPHRGEDIGEFLRQLDGAHAAGEVRADADDFGDARRLGSGDHLRQLLGKLWISEMGVGVIEHRHNSAARLPAHPAPLKALKSEIRRPKSDRWKRREVQRPPSLAPFCTFGFRVSDLVRTSGFGIRTWAPMSE